MGQNQIKIQGLCFLTHSSVWGGGGGEGDMDNKWDDLDQI